jgi:hypothetical protein
VSAICLGPPGIAHLLVLREQQMVGKTFWGPKNAVGHRQKYPLEDLARSVYAQAVNCESCSKEFSLLCRCLARKSKSIIATKCGLQTSSLETGL